MNRSEMNRRDFQKLAVTAFGGIVAGTAAGRIAFGAEEKSLMLSEPHVCRGLNTCKGMGKGKDNACAGQGGCALAAAHDCAGLNECKGQGGCDTSIGENKCKGMGKCHVPLKDDKWSKARKRFEEVMAKEGKKVGPAPAKK